jgi:hypothetical protein
VNISRISASEKKTKGGRISHRISISGKESSVAGGRLEQNHQLRYQRRWLDWVIFAHIETNGW